ncbi:MAG: Crp/Fnr family transcriptional regulator [Candidatus Rokubacteria bacterium]|nr:Crp/Fnr family transcriptional regulator [Candidatus Rokubacteria bacterium]MBI3826379.1 Crp/Fnr family transcriptional regulator [Candidatus Rokubacteria bacterium]
MTKVTAELVRAFTGVGYLAGLPPAERAGLAARSAVRTAARGQTIYAEGEPAAGLFVVLDGRVKLVRRSAQGREQVLHAEGSGATLAEVPVFDGGGYVASAVALEDTRLLFVPREALLDLCRRRPDVALGVIATLAGRVRRFAALIEDLSLRDLTARLAVFLLTEIPPGRDGGGLRMTGDEIAARLGTVREPVSRALSRLRRLGLVERARGLIVVRDRRGLSAIARH